jgi:hypothetical protein
MIGKDTETQPTLLNGQNYLASGRWISVADLSTAELQFKMQATLAATVREEERYP